jgi:hypothetical protein
MVISNNFIGHPAQISLGPLAMTQSPHPILERAAANGVALEMQGAVAVVRLCRPAKRNALNDALIEAKGRLHRSFQDAFADVLRACPRLDVRFVFQYPHRRGQVEGSPLTPAQWADARGLRWGTLDDIEALTADLPRVRPAGPGAPLVAHVAGQTP